ncbi:hypothetical protein F5Y04DRAFT_275909 [Hypomontagnella monticulosa]|nr:hypothetical protein F5Y04DRAFT_275909 [Hypomontagnella monticulosa]
MEPAVPVKTTKSKLSTLETLPVEIIQHIMYQVDINTLRKLILVSSRLYNVYMGATEVILYHVTANEMGSWGVFGAALARYASSKPDLNPGIDNFLIENPGHDLAAKFTAGDEIYRMDVSGFRMPKSYFTPSVVMEILGFHELVEDVVARFEDVVDDALIEGYDLDEYEPRTYYTPLERLQMKTAIVLFQRGRIRQSSSAETDDPGAWFRASIICPLQYGTGIRQT